jgi:hypothetical protein
VTLAEKLHNTEVGTKTFINPDPELVRAAVQVILPLKGVKGDLPSKRYRHLAYPNVDIVTTRAG